MSFNIQSLQAKFHEFSEFISFLTRNSCSPDVICLQEIWKIVDGSILSIPGYNIIEYQCRHSNAQGGGVAFYIKKGINYNILYEKMLFVDRIFESIFVEVWIPGKSRVIIGSIYRPKSAHPTLTSSDQFNQFCELYSNAANDILALNVPVYFCGDFNLDLLNYASSPQVAEFVDISYSFGLLQIINKRTRCTANSATLIDFIFTNANFSQFRTAILINKMSDHFPIIHFIEDTKRVKQDREFEMRDFLDHNINLFKEKLNAVNWSHVTETEDM